MLNSKKAIKIIIENIDNNIKWIVFFKQTPLYYFSNKDLNLFNRKDQ